MSSTRPTVWKTHELALSRKISKGTAVVVTKDTVGFTPSKTVTLAKDTKAVVSFIPTFSDLGRVEIKVGGKFMMVELGAVSREG